jgi:Putative peptidoglycan binding domain
MVLFATAMACANTSTSKANTAAHHSSRRRSHKHVAKVHGQQKIDPQRAQQIQQALIREHYLDGEASGVWDDASQRAIKKYQAANGWQTKVVPDSRALIKLGLGPDHDHLLNPESAMTTPPQLIPSVGSGTTDSREQRK